MTRSVYTLPRQGLSHEKVLQCVREFRAKDPPFARGQMTAYCMMGSHELQSVLEGAYRVYFFQNALTRRFLPGLRINSMTISGRNRTCTTA